MTHRGQSGVATLTVSDVQIGAVEIKDATAATRAKVAASGSVAEGNNVLAVQAPVLGITTGTKVITDAAATVQQYLRGLVSLFEAGAAATAAALGTTSGAKVVTDANGTVQQYLRGLVSLFEAGAAAIATVSGATGDAAVDTDTTGTISGKLRGLVKLFAARIPVLGQAAAAASAPVVQADAEVTTVYTAVTMSEDRLSVEVDKSGRNIVAIDIAMTQGGGGPFDAVGEILVLAGNGPGLAEKDALSVPSWTISIAETVKFELETAYSHIRLLVDWTSGGADDTIDATIAVS